MNLSFGKNCFCFFSQNLITLFLLQILFFSNVCFCQQKQWTSLSDGMKKGGVVSDILKTPNGSIFVAGLFSQIQSTPANNIGMWDGSNWNSLQNGTNGEVYVLAFDSNSNQLYVGGSFSQAGSTPNTSNVSVNSNFKIT